MDVFLRNDFAFLEVFEVGEGHARGPSSAEFVEKKVNLKRT